MDADSIREMPDSPFAGPDFAAPGIWLRVLLAVNLIAFVAVVASNRDTGLLADEFLGVAAMLEPTALLALSALALAGRHVRQRSTWLQLVAVTVAAAASAWLVAAMTAPLRGGSPIISGWRPALVSAAMAATLFHWLHLRTRAQAPAVTEARLQALTARIRPHFLFNTLNAVLGVIRSEPRRAEAALEEMADLFRALMKENRTLHPLSEEIALARQYLNLERLRLGDRLQVRWDVESCPPDALVPPLLLQPLIENAVYHGIEPASEPAEIRVRFSREGDRIVFELENPLADAASHSHGNQMALANIRERLALFFDLEAGLDAAAADGCYRVRIQLPYRVREGR